MQKTYQLNLEINADTATLKLVNKEFDRLSDITKQFGGNLPKSLKSMEADLRTTKRDLQTLNSELENANIRLRSLYTARSQSQKGIFRDDVLSSKELIDQLNILKEKYTQLQRKRKTLSGQSKIDNTAELNRIKSEIARIYSDEAARQAVGIDSIKRKLKELEAVEHERFLRFKNQASKEAALLKNQGTFYERLKAKVLGLNSAQNRSVGVTGRLARANRNLTNDLVRHIRRVESLAVAYYGLSRAYKATIGAGIAFNKEMEDTGVMITSIIASTSQNKAKSPVGTTRAVDDTEKWKIAAQEANRYKKALIQINAQTPTTLEETTKIFSILLPQMRQHNASQKDALKLTKLVAIATKAGNVSMVEAKAALDGLLNGTTKSTSELMVYLKTLGITNEKLKEMGKQGKVMEYLLETLGRLEPAGALIADTMTGRLNVLANEWKTLMGTSTEGLFSGFKDEITSLTEYIKTNKEEWIVSIRTFVDDVKDMGTSIYELYQSIKESFANILDFAGVSTEIFSLRDAFVGLSDAIRTNKELLGEFIAGFVALRLGGGIVSGILSIAGATTAATAAMGVFKVAASWLFRGGLLGAGIIWLIQRFTGIEVSFKKLGEVANLTWVYIQQGLYALIEGIGTGVNTIYGFFANLGVGVQNMWNSVINTIMQAWYNMINSLASSLNSFLNSAVSGINSMIDKVNSIAGKVGIKGFGKISPFNIKGIGEYKKRITDATAATKDFIDISDFAAKKSGLQSKIDGLKQSILGLKDETTEFKKVLGDTVAVGEKIDIGNNRLTYNAAKRKAELYALKKGLTGESLLPIPPEPEKDEKAARKAARAAQKALKEQIRWNQKFTNDYNQATMSRYEFEKNKLDELKNQYLQHGEDKVKVAQWYNAELAKLDQQRLRDEERNAKKAWKNGVWGSGAAKKDFNKSLMQAGASCKDGKCGGGFMSPSESKKAAAQAGKTFGGSFKDAIAGKKAQKSYESIGSKLGSAFGSAIRGALQDYINGDGNISLEDASAKQFDSKIGGALRSSMPSWMQIGLDVFNAMNTQSKNAFQKMDVNIDEDNTGIADSVKMLSDVMNPNLEYTKKMAKNLEQMNNSFAVIAVGIRSSTGLDINSATLSSNNLSSGKQLFDAAGNLTSTSLGGNSGGIGDLVNGFLKSMFGSTQKDLEAAGLYFGEQTAQSVIDGVLAGSKYQDIKIKKSAAFGLLKSTKFQTKLEDLDTGTKNEFVKAFTAGYENILSSASILGLKSFDPNSIKFDEAKLDLKGKSIEDQQKIIAGLWAARLDKVSLAAMKDLKDYQAAGETDFTTIQRIGVQYEQAASALHKLGIETVKFTDVVNKATGAFDLETMRTSILLQEGARFDEVEKKAVNWINVIKEGLDSKDVTKAGEWINSSYQNNGFDKVLNDSALTGIGEWVKAFQGTSQEFNDGYKKVTDFQFAMRVFGNKMSEFSVEMINGAGSLDALVSGQKAYFDNFFTAQERSTIELAKMNKEFSVLGLTMPKTKDEFRALVESTRDNNKELYGSLLAMSDTVAKAMKAQEDLVKKSLANIEKVRDVIFSTSGISQYDLAQYAKLIYKDAMKAGDRDTSLKYAQKYTSLNAKTGFSPESYYAQLQTLNDISLKYGDKVKIQDVRNPELEKQNKELIEAVRTMNDEIKELNSRVDDLTSNDGRLRTTAA